jgi:LL-diaminopimelate aminotransferase
MRIGFVVGNRDAVEALAAYRTNVGYGTPTVMQAAATYALNHYAELVPATVAEYRARRDAMMQAFHAAGWNAEPPPASMYLWLPTPEGTDDWEWVRTLIDEDGIVVTPGLAFGDGGRGYFRVSLVRDRDVLARAAATIGARREAMLQRA